MPLKKAAQYYTGHESTVSPLWRRIATGFQAQFLAEVDDREYDDDRLYVSARRPLQDVDGRHSSDGLDEQDVDEYLRDDRRRLLAVVAPAGLGKTTFLRHVIRPFVRSSAFAVVWIDVLRDVVAPERLERQVARLVDEGLGRAISQAPPASASWSSYLLEHRSDTAGLLAIVRDELERTGSLRPSSVDSLLHLSRDLGASGTELIRLRLQYLRAVAQRTPVVVIDNIDQLPARSIDALVRFGYALAAGPSSVTSDGAADASAKVVIAMRPLTSSVAQRAVGTMLQGALLPPDIDQVMQRRIDWFLESYDKKILPGATLPLPRRGAIHVRDLVDADEEAVPETLARDLLRQVARVMVSDRTPYGDIANLVFKLNNGSTRMCLFATAQYIASGHIDWPGLFRAIQQGRSLDSFLTWPKVLRAMFLGVRVLYRSDGGWLYNLFNDGEPDRVGVVIRPRLLKALASAPDGIAAEELAGVLERLFGYPSARIARALRDACERGLVHEPTAERFTLTDAGMTYLKWMTKEFEYLQHVVMDAWVDNPYLVRASGDEVAEIRYRRVLQFAAWVRSIELADYRHVLRSAAEPIYDRYYGDDTLSGALCASLLATDRLRGAISPDEWAPLHEQTRELAKAAELAALRRDALAPVASS